MPSPRHQGNLARYVASRAHTSIHLLGGLRGALRDLGRRDLVAILDLVARHAKEAHTACIEQLATQKQEKCLRVLTGLQQLTELGGPAARGVVTSLAHDLVSGAHKIYPGD